MKGDIDDILGISQTKLGFFQEWQLNLRALKNAHYESERQRMANAAILEGITDAMMVLDENLRIISVNKVMEKLFPDRRCVGEYCYSLFTRAGTPCPECPAFLSLLHNTVNRESAIFQIDGRNMHFDMVASPLPGRPGGSKAVVMFKRDVTREKAMLAQIYQSEKMASIGTLAAGVAHEINNPLTAIAGFAEGIQRRIPRLRELAPDELTSDLAEYTETILQECNRCRDIVQALVNFSRPHPARNPVYLNSLVEEALSLLRHTVKHHAELRIELHLDHSLPPIWVDDTQVRQVVLNLVTNAIDALTISAQGQPVDSPQGTIAITTFHEKGFAVLQVEDTGGGAEPHQLRNAFEPFFTTKPKGLGLGLAVCYSAVKAHGGDIALARTSENTTKATVHLPLFACETAV